MHPQKWYHKVGDFVVVKRAWEFSQFPTPLYFIHPIHQPIIIMNNLVSTNKHHTNDLAIIYCTLPHHTTALKPPNIPYKKTLNITNTIISSQQKKALKRKNRASQTYITL